MSELPLTQLNYLSWPFLQLAMVLCPQLFDLIQVFACVSNILRGLFVELKT